MSATILLVDDDEVLGQVLQRVLSRQGWTVLQANTAAQALRLAREQRPDLGLLDLCLPDGDGVELAQHLTNEVGRFPLILMTAYPLRLRDHPELARQFHQVLTKPLNLEELRHAVEAALAGQPAAVAPDAAAFDPASATLATREPVAASGPMADMPGPGLGPVEAPVAMLNPPATDAGTPPSVTAGATPAPMSRTRRAVAFAAGLAVLFVGAILILGVLDVPGIPNVLKLLAEKPVSSGDSAPTSLKLVAGSPDTFDLDPKAVTELKVPPPTRIDAVALPHQLEMSGSLAFDPNRLARIQARFGGEIVELGLTETPTRRPEDAGASPVQLPPPRRPLRYGDKVTAGQLMAVVWSKDLGEKKSELVDGLVKLSLDEESLEKYEALYRAGATSEANVRAQRNAVSADLNAIARSRRTLRIWRVTQTEIDDVEAEADSIIKSKNKTELNALKPNIEQWARVEVRAPFTGVIVEKNANVHAIIDTTFDLYKVADLKHLAVFANAYEEDLRTLQDLQARFLPGHLPWRVNLVADPTRAALKGFGLGGRTEIDRIGFIVDPTQHTNLVIGLVDNRDERMHVGQFVMTSVELPAPPGVVSVPSAALVEDGKDAVLFVQPDPNKPRYTMKRVVVVQRFQGVAYVRSRLTEAQKALGFSEIKPGDRVVPGAAVELKSALEEVQAKANAKKREEENKQNKENKGHAH